MYKTISINNSTYQQLHALATKLQKPKSQVVDDLVREYIDRMHEEEKISLKAFNSSVKRLAKRVKLPRGTKITSVEPDMSSLAQIKQINVQKLEKRK